MRRDRLVTQGLANAESRVLRMLGVPISSRFLPYFSYIFVNSRSSALGRPGRPVPANPAPRGSRAAPRWVAVCSNEFGAMGESNGTIWYVTKKGN
jgi:hypothetical protein